MKKTLLVITGIILSLSTISSPAFAEPEQKKQKSIRLVCQLGASAGGDKMATATYDNGNTVNIHAGGGLSGSVGFIANPFSTLNNNLETQVTIGYKEDSTNAENGDITFSRIPVELLQFYRFKKFRLGAGLSYHIDPTLDGDGVAGNIHADFDDALGLSLEADYFFGLRGFVGLKTTFIDYDYKTASINGNSYGLVLGAVF